jgi:hypothetical protein
MCPDEHILLTLVSTPLCCHLSRPQTFFTDWITVSLTTSYMVLSKDFVSLNLFNLTNGDGKIAARSDIKIRQDNASDKPS